MNYSVNLYRKLLCWRNESNHGKRIGKIEEKVNDNDEEAYGLLCYCH